MRDRVRLYCYNGNGCAPYVPFGWCRLHNCDALYAVTIPVHMERMCACVLTPFATIIYL